jgi:AcrR family transcriptional regulator
VLEAARELFAEQGAEVSVAAVAERAGVGIGTLYRRYRTKQALLQHLCVLAMEQAIEAADAALATTHPWDGLVSYVETCVRFGSGGLSGLAGRIETTPEMRQLSQDSRRRVRALVQRAKREGALRRDVSALDIAWLIEFFGRPAVRPATREDENVRRRLLAIALEGLRTPAPHRLPGRPPTAAHYEARWGAADPR